MAIKSTQIIHIKATRGDVTFSGTCRVIKYEHQKNDPESEGVPQREVLILNASGDVVVRITKFFRHLLIECDGVHDTTDKLLKLTPENVRPLAEHLLVISGKPERIVEAAIARIEYLYSRLTAAEQANSDD